jgi:hypothetical protein
VSRRCDTVQDRPLSGAEQAALAILGDGVPHLTWGRATDANHKHWNREERGMLNAGVAGRLVAMKRAHYSYCDCCGAFVGVLIGPEP